MFLQVVLVLSNVIIILLKKDFTTEILTFIQIEPRRSNVMTSARIQPFCRKYNINKGYYDGCRVSPRNITERRTALKMHKCLFCLTWKSKGFSFIQVIEDDLKPNYKVVDNVISDKHVKSFIKYEYKHKKVQSQLTIMIVYDIENSNTIKCVPYSKCICRLSKKSGKYNRDIV